MLFRRRNDLRGARETTGEREKITKQFILNLLIVYISQP